MSELKYEQTWLYLGNYPPQWKGQRLALFMPYKKEKDWDIILNFCKNKLKILQINYIQDDFLDNHYWDLEDEFLGKVGFILEEPQYYRIFVKRGFARMHGYAQETLGIDLL